MPTILRIKNYRFFFFSREFNEPPHIHVESDDNYAKFWLDPVELSRSVGYDARELNDIRKLIITKCILFKEKWNEYFSR
ncbi:MAG: DUF4160 domain-containing protein [Bacteroidota bacterium]|nr:DUF4160 domain-containing protein [Bacteroidota bacterium]